MLPPPDKAAGRLDVYCQDQNLGLTIRKVRPKCGFSDDQVGLGRMVFLLHLSGMRRIELGEKKYQLSEPTLAIYYHAQGLNKRSVWSRNADEMSLTIGMWPQGLESLCDVSSTGLSEIPSLCDNEGDVFWHERPLPYALVSATENLLHNPVDPRLAKAYISAKSTEIVCLSLNTLLGDGDFLSRQDVAQVRLDRVKSLIDANIINPPSLCDMAAAFGVSAHDLSNEIRLGTGNNLGQYITNRRMARARMLLEAGNLPLKQVAFEVGYSHASNFCTAFKRHFGKPPKSLLRHCH
jgi:AraC-like DNA-binding protein